MTNLESFTNYLKVLKINQSFFKYEPLALRLEYKLDSDMLSDAFMCHTIFHTLRVFDEFELFRNIVLGFNNRPSDFSMEQDVTPAEIAWTLKAIRTFLDPKTPFSDEVLTYIAAEMYQEGFFDVSTLDPINKEKSIESGLDVNTLLQKMMPVGISISNEAKKKQAEDFSLIRDYVNKRMIKQKEEIRELKQ